MFGDKGWIVFEHDPAIESWAHAAHRVALDTVNRPEMRDLWLQCQGTWFVGVDILDNDTEGAIDGQAFPPDLRAHFPDGFHPAQVSIIYPGYPKPRGGESDAAFRYRLNRDAAHVDGLLAEGPSKRRYLREPHRYVVGVPLTRCNAEASPMVVWEGSHVIIQHAFAKAFDGVAPRDWPKIDVTDIYQAARREVFDHCSRVIIHADLGQAYAIHPLALHGVAPWGSGAVAPPEGRMIAYFRPQFSDWSQWLAV